MLGFPAAFLRQVLPQIVRAEAAAAARERLDRRQRAGRDRHRVLLGAVVDDPHQLRPVGAVVARRLVADDQQVALEERHDGVREAGVRRVVVPARHHLRVRLVGDVEDDHAAVDIAHVHAVRPLRVDVGVVRAEAGVEAGPGMARRRRDVVAFLRAGQPPAADLDRLRRVAHVDALIELVVVRVRSAGNRRRPNSCGCTRRRRTTAGGRRASSGRSGRKTRSASGFPGSRCRTARRRPRGSPVCCV